MMRPFTCLCLLAALGSGLYLYSEKHRAQMLDRDISRTVKQADATRERIGLLRAEWALLNEPDRLSALATQYLVLQSLAPTQFTQLADLPNRLPAPVLTPALPPMDEPQLPLTIPLAAVAPVSQPRAPLAVAAAVPVRPAPAGPAASAKLPAQLAALVAPKPVPVQLAAAAPVAAQPPKPAPVPPAAPVQLAAAHPAPHHAATPRPDAEPASRLAAATPKPEPDAERPGPFRPVFAPIVPAYQHGPSPVVHAPTVQTAAATTNTYAPSAYAAAAPFVGSALGMARTILAAPVPVASAATPGR